MHVHPLLTPTGAEPVGVSLSMSKRVNSTKPKPKIGRQPVLQTNKELDKTLVVHAFFSWQRLHALRERRLRTGWDA